MSSPEPRALPSRPDLEYERKQAKRLLRSVRNGDPDALRRIHAQDRSLATVAPVDIRLSHAQLAIAREYGFRSWPLLVQYFEAFSRHERSPISRSALQRGPMDGWVRTIVAEHRDRRAWTAMLLGSFVPRFYGATIDEIFAAEVTEAEARLVVAREYGFARWEDMVAYQDANPRPNPMTYAPTPVDLLARAIAQSDIGEMDRLVTQHGTGLTDLEHHDRLASAALARGPFVKEVYRPVIDWLRARGVDLQPALNRLLIGGFGAQMQPASVRLLIGLGADPSWIAPNGYAILEHALYRYWNGEAVDVLLEYVRPRDTFWISAGVGDAKRLRRYFDRAGKLRPDARRDRPDFMALSGHTNATLPVPSDDMLLWEAAFVASVNGRDSTLDVVLEHGFDIDQHWGMTLLAFAVGNELVPMVERLLARGASPHVRGWRPAMTALEMAASRVASNQSSPDMRRILELLGGDPA